MTSQLTARRRGSLIPVPLVLLLPALALVALVSVVPAIYAVQISFHETNYLEIGDFAGLANYVELVQRPESRGDLLRTLIYVVGSLALAVPLSLALALLLNQEFRFRRIVRILVLLPWVISQTVAALLWQWMLDPAYGPLSLSVDVLARPASAMAALIVVNVWASYPLAAMLQLAALSGIPVELYESAKVDGANAWRRLWSVSIPLILPTLLIATILLTLLYFNMVTLIYTLTAGGPYSGTQVLSLQAFRESFLNFNIGLGAAYTVVLFVLNVVFAIAYVRALRTER